MSSRASRAAPAPPCAPGGHKGCPVRPPPSRRTARGDLVDPRTRKTHPVTPGGFLEEEAVTPSWVRNKILVRRVDNSIVLSGDTLGNPAKKIKNPPAKKPDRCTPWLWGARVASFSAQKCCLAAADSRDSSQRCRALLASQPGSKACALPACLPSVGLPAFSPPRARDPGFIFQVVVATLTLLLDQLQKFARFGRKPRDQVRHDRYTSGQTSSGEKGRSPDVL